MDKLPLLPRVSEKAYALSKDRNVYVFDVDLRTSKTAIARAVEQEFGVSVESVNTQIAKGKQKRMFTKRGRATQGKRKDIKRAYVTVAEGDTIPVFAAIDEAEKKSEQLAKQAAKKAKKAKKKEKK